MLDDEHLFSDAVQQVASVTDYIPEGNFHIFEALQREGKTLAEVMFAYDEWLKGRTIHSTILLGFPHEELQFTEIKLGDGRGRFQNGHIVADELNFFFDCRKSLSKGNVEKGSFLLQSKKQGCNLTGTTHSIRYLDNRARDNYDYLWKPRVWPAFPRKPEYITIEIENGPTMRRFYKKFRLPVAPYLGLYDTRHVYDLETMSQ